jgi:hypothetical protein
LHARRPVKRKDAIDRRGEGAEFAGVDELRQQGKAFRLELTFAAHRRLKP